MSLESKRTPNNSRVWVSGKELAQKIRHVGRHNKQVKTPDGSTFVNVMIDIPGVSQSIDTSATTVFLEHFPTDASQSDLKPTLLDFATICEDTRWKDHILKPQDVQTYVAEQQHNEYLPTQTGLEVGTDEQIAEDFEDKLTCVDKFKLIKRARSSKIRHIILNYGHRQINIRVNDIIAVIKNESLNTITFCLDNEKQPFVTMSLDITSITAK